MAIIADPFTRSIGLPVSDAQPVDFNFQTGIGTTPYPISPITPEQQASNSALFSPFGQPYTMPGFEANQSAALLSTPLGLPAGPGDNSTNFGDVRSYTGYESPASDRMFIEGKWYAVNITNFASLANAKIAERERKEGVKLSDSQKAAIIQAFRTLAYAKGQPPVSRSETDVAATGYRDIDNQIVYKVANGATTAISNTANFLGETAKGVVEGFSDFSGNLFGTTKLVAIAAIVIGGAYLIKTLK